MTIFTKCLPWALSLLILASCKTVQPPEVTYAECALPAVPDYSLMDHWAAHPDREDEADGTPGLETSPNQTELPIDVFFVHPTTFNTQDAWNGSVQDEKLCKTTVESAIRHQASVFNAAGRVYAPFYRQMVYQGFFYETLSQKRDMAQAYHVAYQDVKNAFVWYLENENQGRPFILAGHSQGSGHAIHLLKEFVDGKPLADQLVAAYLPGWPVPADTFSVLKPCANAMETGCYASWCTYADGYMPPAYETFYEGATVVNPVTWTLDESWSEREDHQGMVMKGYKKILPQKLEARVKGSILWVTKPDIFGKALINYDNYHIADINLFWLDIRKNAVLRSETYLVKKGQ